MLPYPPHSSYVSEGEEHNTEGAFLFQSTADVAK